MAFQVDWLRWCIKQATEVKNEKSLHVKALAAWSTHPVTTAKIEHPFNLKFEKAGKR